MGLLTFAREGGEIELEKQEKPKVIPKRARKKGKKASIKKNYDVQIIPAKAPSCPDTENELPKIRVGAYCRVSTDEEAQASSFELQVDYYTGLINSRDDWVLAGIYADEGISGTQTRHRDNFNRMIEDCKAHKIDMIITKSISRFARNVVDCISTVRMLKALSPPVNVYFEKERIDSLDEKMEVFLTMMASFAQEESRSISTNIRWAIKNRMKEGTQKIPTSSLLGYDTDDDYNFIIVESEAQVVRTIYSSFLRGTHPAEIAETLNGLGCTTVLGNPWSASAVKNILRNEKYCGDVLMQKTITVDYLTHKTKKNEGEADQYFIPDHHVGIVSHEDWDRAQELLERIAGKRRKKKKRQQRLIPQKKGRLRGFIAINPQWSTVSHTRLVTATEKVLAIMGIENVEQTTTEREVITMGILEGFEVVNLVAAKGASTLTATASSLKFNKATATELNYPPYIRMLVDAKNRKVAIQPCTEKDPNAVSFSAPEEKQTYAIIVKVPALVAELRRMLQFEKDGRKVTYTISGTCYPEENVIIYDLADAKMSQSRGGRKKQKAEVAEDKKEAGELEG